MAIAQVMDRLRGSSLKAVFFRGAAGSLVVQVAGTAIGFVVQVCLARWLGRDAFGDYVIATAWLSVLVLVGKSGMDTAALRFVAAYRGREEFGKLRGFLTRSHQIVLLSSAVIALLAAGGVGALAQHIRSGLLAVLLVAWALLPVHALLELSAACMRGLQRVVIAQLPVRIVRPLLLLAGVALLVVLRESTPTAAQAMGAHLAAAAAALAITLLGLWYFLPQQLRETPPEFETRHWCGVAVPLLFISGMHVVLGQTDLLMLGALRGSAETAVYGAAVRVATLVGFGLLAVNMMVAPMIADLHARGDVRQLQSVTGFAAWGILAFALPVTVLLVGAGPWILGLFGPGFREGYAPLIILLGGRLLGALAGSVGFLMSMTGHQREAAKILGVALVVNVSLNAVLIPWIGIAGAATATATTVVLWNSLMLAYVVRVLKINPTILPLRISH